MKNLTKKMLAAAALLTAVAQAQADTGQFTYTFGDGEVLSGTFVGQLVSGSYTNLTDVHAWMNGVAVAGGAALSVGSYQPDYSLVNGSAQLSAQFANNNFYFADQSDVNSPAVNESIGLSTIGGASVIGYGNASTGAVTGDAFINDGSGLSYSTGPNGYNNSSTTLIPQWHLSTVSAVPEPSEVLMLALGLGVLALGLRRRA